MEESLPALKHKRRWQLGIYAISIYFMAGDIFFDHYGYGFFHITNLFDAFKPYFLFIAFPLLSISLFLAVISPRLGARAAIAAAAISLVFYLVMCVINLLIHGPYLYFDVDRFYLPRISLADKTFFDIVRFYLPRIFLVGTTFIFSHKILQSPAEQVELLIPMLFFKLRWTPKMQRNVVSAFIIMFGIVSIQWLYPRASCAVIGGEWIRDGMFGQAQYCLHSYPDAGKACQNSDDCMGRCLADTNSLSAETGIPTSGVCAPTNQVFGCFSSFENQEIYSWCAD